MSDSVSLAVSILALAISSITAWLTFFRRGTVKMTQPTVIFFGTNSTGLPKIYMRTLLFSTSRRGSVIENMHVALSRNETHQNFNIWVYGDEKLVRGSGLFVGETGVAANHHFLPPDDGSNFRFSEGDYRVEVFAHLYGDRAQKLLLSQELHVSADLAAHLAEPDTGLYFDLAPTSAQYLPHIDRRPPSLRPDDFLRYLMPERFNEPKQDDQPSS